MQQVRQPEAVYRTVESKARSERRAGELLAKVERTSGPPTKGGPRPTRQRDGLTYSDTLKEAGISEPAGHRCQSIAGLNGPLQARRCLRSQSSGRRVGPPRIPSADQRGRAWLPPIRLALPPRHPPRFADHATMACISFPARSSIYLAFGLLRPLVRRHTLGSPPSTGSVRRRKPSQPGGFYQDAGSGFRRLDTVAVAGSEAAFPTPCLGAIPCPVVVSVVGIRQAGPGQTDGQVVGVWGAQPTGPALSRPHIHAVESRVKPTIFRPRPAGGSANPRASSRGEI